MNNEQILVVDDSRDNLFLIQTILQEEGYKITLAENGFKALEFITNNPPHLVLLDVMMPELDGYEVTKRIKQDKNLPFIPILLITAYDRANVVKGLDIGADDFIRKPVQVDELLARVRSLIRLKNTVDERDEISKQREDYVSRLTHDLRTPLVAADRMLNLLYNGALGELSPSIQEVINIMSRSNKNLMEMVNTLLEVYRFEAGRKKLLFLPVDLLNILTEVKQELLTLAEEKKLKLNLDLPENKIEIMGDRLELIRVFTNIIGNGIKFTDKGEINVRIILIENEVKIEIEDTGNGISPEDQLMLFKRFRPGSNKSSGSGLGLHLSKLIVDAHYGTIEVKSELGKGSLFTVTLAIIK
ncbi:MAG TPA: hybrid sensor histidine kinase/response regulator [Allocoleopsis sp.]